MIMTLRQLVLAVVLCFALVSPGHAYLDPGTGSIILQGLLASVAVAFGFLRLYWHRFKSFFSGRSQANESEIAQDNGQDPNEPRYDNNP